MEKEKNTRKKVIVLSVVLIILGIIIIGWEYFLSKKDYVYQEMRIKLTYNSVIVNPDKDVSDEMINGFKEGVKLNDGECKSALLEKVDTNKCFVTLTEGRYHQIKRMFGCYKAKVLELKRICMGELYLPTNLAVGEVREVSDEELIKIQSKK